MQVNTLSLTITGKYKFVELECGKTRAMFIVSPTSFDVKVDNASSRAWGNQRPYMGAGKMFSHAAQALDHYRSKPMRAMIAQLQAAGH